MIIINMVVIYQVVIHGLVVIVVAIYPHLLVVLIYLFIVNPVVVVSKMLPTRSSFTQSFPSTRSSWTRVLSTLPCLCCRCPLVGIVDQVVAINLFVFEL